VPILKRQLPPADAVAYYTDARNRGYLADPDQIAEERFKLSQKYGYPFIDLKKDNADSAVLLERKDARQIFYGLQPGWLVDLKNKKIYEAEDPALLEYYRSWAWHREPYEVI